MGVRAKQHLAKLLLPTGGSLVPFPTPRPLPISRYTDGFMTVSTPHLGAYRQIHARPNPRRNEPTPPAQKEAASRKRRQPEDVTPDRPKAKRRESTTIVARIGMELYHQMSEIGKQTVNQELGWRRGIG